MFAARLVYDFNFTLKDAWNTTAREYYMLLESKKNRKPIHQNLPKEQQADIITNFKLREIYNAVRV